MFPNDILRCFQFCNTLDDADELDSSEKEYSIMKTHLQEELNDLKNEILRLEKRKKTLENKNSLGSASNMNSKSSNNVYLLLFFIVIYFFVFYFCSFLI